MKRLLTLIGVVATLLLTPTNAKAWGDLYLLNNIWGLWGSTDTNSDYKFTKVNDNEFTYTLDASNYERDIYWKINTPGDWSGQREIHPDNDGQDVGESGYNAKYDGSYSGKSFKISHSTNNYTHYTITARWDSGGEGYWNVKVVGSGSKGTTQAVYLLGTINSWTGNSYKLEKDGDEYKLELTKAQVQNALHQGDFYFRFKEEMDNSKTYTVVPQTDQTPLTVDGDYTSVTYATTKTDDSKKDFYWKFTPTGADKYFIYFKNENNTRKVRVATPPHDYYWVSPQITNGEMWPAFKMVASRNRYWDGHQVIGDGKISTKYYTFTIKDDDLVTWKTKSEIGTDTEIQWYILRDDGQVVYRPKTDLTPRYLPHENNPYDNNHPISGNTDNDGYVSFINYWNGRDYDGADAYMTTDASRSGSWAFNKGTAKAHTFNLNAEKGHVLYNYTNKGASTTRGYNLVGNWTADTKASIHLSEGKSMDKYWFKEGVGHQIADDVEVADADSIVYKINITKEALHIDSWGGLYLDISPSDNGTADNPTNWGNVFRPLITTGNNLDGRALHGALTTRKDEQSLNPETSENYLGYTFSFNATTMTYRLEFHTPDATLSPGTEDGNVDFKGSVSEDIAVDLTDGADGIHTEATQYAIGFGADANFDLSETNKYTNTKFNLSFNGSTNEITYTSAGGNNYTGTVSGSSIYVKVRGFDISGNYGDIHTYKYTFHSKIGFEPHGGLFINSAKIRISGGVPPYRYKIYHYDTTIENGETVIDYATGTLRSSGTFSNTAYNADDDNFRISTPGFLKIIDSNDDEVSFEEVGGGFDFTYSTSENYKPYYSNTAGGYSTINADDAGAYPNGADYWLAAPGDMTRLLSPTWHLEGSTETRTANDVQPSWNGEDDNTIPLNTGNEIYQTVTGLTAGTYTVQAIVRGEAKPIHLKLDDNVVNTITLTGDGDGSIASINPYGRCEHLENMQESTSNRSWHKLEGSADVTAGGSLKIAISAEGRAYVADVVLLKDANTLSGFRTTASTLPTDITRYDFRRRQVSGQPSQRQNNAYSFFDRGKNQNAVIFANNKTVIAMDKSLLAPECPNRDKDRRHPFNVVGSTEQDAAMGTAKALYLTDAGYDENDANYLPVRYVNNRYGNNSDAYRAHGYSFCPGLAFYAEDLIFDRDMSQMAVKKTTCMLPVAFTPAQLKTYYGDDLKVYKWTNTNGNDLTFTLQKDADVLNANEPYIFWGAEGSLDTRGQSAGKTDGKFTIGAITSTDHNAAANHSGFPGTYAYKKITRYDKDKVSEAAETRFIYNAANGVFSVVSANGANLKPFRAYFVIGVTDAAAGARQLNIFFDDSIITGIDSVETTAPTSGDIYTIGGVLVAKDGNMSGLPKGIYIMNGKKYVVK